MLINCRLCPLFLYLKGKKKQKPFVLWHFFLCCCSPTSHCKSSFIFHSVDLDISLFLSETGKKNEHLCLLPICCTFARFDAGLQSSVSNPRTPFIFLLKCLLLYPMLMPSRVIFFSLSLFCFNFHYCYKEHCDFNISILLSTAISNLLVCCLVKHLLMRSSSLKSQLLENNREEVKSIILCIFSALFSVF